MDQVFAIYREAQMLFPEDLRGGINIGFGIVVLLLILLAIAKALRLFEWRTMQPSDESVPAPQAPPARPPEPAAISKEKVLSNVAAGLIDRGTAEWLFSQLPKATGDGLPPEALKEAHNAFIETVETMAAAPKPGELEALRRIANGDAKGAFSILDSSIGPDQPDQLQTFAAIAAPADPKLAVESFSRFVSATVSRPMSGKNERIELLYSSPAMPGVEIGLVTGNIADVKGVDAWVNSENDWLSMARTIDRSISAHIRYLSSRRDANGVPLNDPMQQALRPNAYGRIKPMKLGAIRITHSGRLRQSHGVKRILHVVSVKAKPLGNAALVEEPGGYVRDVMRAAEEFNRWPFHFGGSKLKSMLVPMFGTGMAGEKPDAVADMLVDGMLRGIAAISGQGRKPTLRRVQVVAYSTQQYLPMRRAFEKRVATGDLVAAPAPAAKL